MGKNLQQVFLDGVESLKSANDKYGEADQIIKQIKAITTKEERIQLVLTIKKQPYILKEADNKEFLKVVDYVFSNLIKD
jgi:hypothetical protein